MATRTILDSHGAEIGELTLPDETTEDQWATALALYATPAPTPSLPQVIAGRLQAAIAFGEQLILAAATDNVLAGITAAGKTKEVSDFLRGLGRYLREGSLYAAMEEIDRLTSTDIPEEVSGFVTTEKLLGAKAKISHYLGLS